jgi:adenosine deaminase
VDAAGLRAMALTGVDASWLPDAEKAALRASVEADIAALDAEYGIPPEAGLS